MSVPGTVVNLASVKCGADSTPFVQLDLKSGDTIVQWFMDEQVPRLELAKGQVVEVRGSKTMVDGASSSWHLR